MSNKKTETWIFYNLKVGRPRDRVEMELDALINRYQPKGIVGCEANGYALWSMPPLGHPVRDRSTEGKANLYAYGWFGTPRWVQHSETWPRTERPGPHGARASLLLRPRRSMIGRLIVGHAPPMTPESLPARNEWLEEMQRFFSGRPFRRTLALLDANKMGQNLAQLVDGQHDGDLTNCAVARGLDIDVRLAHSADGVAMLSDHPAVVVTVSKRRWLR